MVFTLLFLLGNLSLGNHQLVGNAVTTLCEDSDLKETNDPIAGTIFSRDVYSTINYALRGTTTGLHPQFKTFVTMKDTCISEKKIKEFYCDLKENKIGSVTEDCPLDSRCYQGACVPLVCQDKDGFNIKKKSVVSYTLDSGSHLLTAEDFCESSMKVVEYICPETTVDWSNGVQNVYDYPHDLRRAVHQTCPLEMECKDGACVKK